MSYNTKAHISKKKVRYIHTVLRKNLLFVEDKEPFVLAFRSLQHLEINIWKFPYSRPKGYIGLFYNRIHETLSLSHIYLACFMWSLARWIWAVVKFKVLYYISTSYSICPYDTINDYDTLNRLYSYTLRVSQLYGYCLRNQLFWPCLLLRFIITIYTHSRYCFYFKYSINIVWKAGQSSGRYLCSRVSPNIYILLQNVIYSQANVFTFS